MDGNFLCEKIKEAHDQGYRLGEEHGFGKAILSVYEETKHEQYAEELYEILIKILTNREAIK